MTRDRTAVLYDVHGNLPALEAVLDHARADGVERFILGGDYVLFGAFPKQTLERLRGLDAQWIRGNTERWVSGVEAEDLPGNDLVSRSIRFCRQQLGAKQSGELGGLDKTLTLGECMFCHASPSSDMQSFFPQPMETDPDLLREVQQHTIVFGHTHLQFKRKTGALLLVNPGSVGLPFDGDKRAAYAVWDGQDFELRRVEYPVESYVADLNDRMGKALGDEVKTLTGRLKRAAVADG